MISYLSHWTTNETTMDGAMWSLARGMYEHCYWGEEDVTYVSAWLQDLHKVGYKLVLEYYTIVGNGAVLISRYLGFLG